MAVRLSIPGAQVDVTGPARIVIGALTRLAPFVAVSGIPLRPGTTWSVWYGTHGRPSKAGLDRVRISAATEPPATLWVDHERRRLVLDSDTAPEFAAHLAARYVRILLRLQRATQAGELFLHAGMVACARADRGIAVIGPKRAGKTSTVMAAMLAGAALVGNDDLSVARSAEGWTGYGWPRSVSVRPDTFTALGIPSPETAAPDRPAHPARAAMPQAPTSQAAAVMLLPSELTALLGAPAIRRSAPLTALVFPRFTADVRDTGLHELPAEETAARLRRDLPAQPVKQADFLLPYFPRPPVSDTEEAYEALAADVPGFELIQCFADLAGGAARLNARLAA